MFCCHTPFAAAISHSAQLIPRWRVARAWTGLDDRGHGTGTHIHTLNHIPFLGKRTTNCTQAVMPLFRGLHFSACAGALSVESVESIASCHTHQSAHHMQSGMQKRRLSKLHKCMPGLAFTEKPCRSFAAHTTLLAQQHTDIARLTRHQAPACTATPVVHTPAQRVPCQCVISYDVTCICRSLVQSCPCQALQKVSL